MTESREKGERGERRRTKGVDDKWKVRRRRGEEAGTRQGGENGWNIEGGAKEERAGRRSTDRDDQ